MKQIFHIFSISFLLCLPSVASAQYFQVGGIAYNVLSDTGHTVEVSQKNNPYRGNISIPPTVTYGGITYDVVALGEYAFYGATLSGVAIPSSVTSIKTGCFRDANGPTTISVPASVENIEMWAFAANRMTSIDVDEANPYYRTIDGMLFSKDTSTMVECPTGKGGEINLPQNTRHIAPAAFYNCKTVTGVVLPEGLASIGFWAFVGANLLNNVAVPSSVSELGSDLFGGCTALDNLTIEAGNTHYYMDGSMILSIDGDTLLSCHKCADSVFLPSTLRVVYGFLNNRGVKYVHVPEGTTTIGGNAFANSSLQSIDLPSQMERIDGYAFSDCESLARVAMPVSLDSMGNGAFYYCPNLTSIDIPDGLHTVPQEAFFACESLSDITWGDSITVIDSFAFGACAFTELSLPASLRVIRCGAFNGYYDGTIRRLVFNAPIDTIESETFYGQLFESVRLKNSQPPIVTTYNGMYGPLDNARVDSIFIPCGSLSAYLADEYWEQFDSKYHEDCEGIDDIATDAINVYYCDGRIVVEGADGETVRVYDIVGQPVVNQLLPSGVYIIKVGDRPARKVSVIR